MVVAADPRVARMVLRDGTEVTAAVDATRAAKDSAVTLGIRPEHVVHTGEARSDAKGEPYRDRELAGGGPAADGRVRGEVVLVENLGESALVYVRVPETDRLTWCRIEGTSRAKEGDVIELSLAADVCHVFDAEGRAFPRTVDVLPGASERRAS
jgi:multiple sugar transport system ATP-binding protein